MGSSQTVYIYANQEEIQKGPCFPMSDFNQELFEYTRFKIDVGIDESLLRYSGTDSTVKLHDYSNELQTELGSKLPDYVEKVGSALAGFTPVPNAVGIGALAISMILHFCFFASKQSTSKEPNPEDMLRRVFAEEKSSEVRDLMEHYLNRYRMYVKQEQRLLQETKRVEEQLASQLTRLKNSMLKDGHMDDRALKHWANGAAFHAQMLIHIARLKKKEGVSEFENAKMSARSAIDTYNKHLYDLIEKYKTHKASEVVDTGKVIMAKWIYLCCVSKKCCTTKCDISANPDEGPKQFLSDIFSVNRQIVELQKYFSDLQKNYAVLTGQLGTFKVPRN